MALSCGGAPNSVNFSIVISVSFSVYRFRFIVFVEDHTASVAVAVAVDPPSLQTQAALH